MVLLDNGLGIQSKSWKVDEANAIGYSRVYYIISGEVDYFDKYTHIRLEKGKMYVFPNNIPYRMSHNSEKPIECLWFHMDFFPYSIERVLEFNIDNIENPTLYHTINALKSEGKNFKENDNLYISLTEALSIQILKHPLIKKTDTAFAEILRYIRENLFESTLNVLSISERFGYSTSHFIRIFKHFMNTTPHKYIVLLRMNSATKYLNEGIPVLQIASLCGYTDVKTFSRVFKKSFGVAPSNYRKFYNPKA